MHEILEKLGQKFPEKAIQETKDEITGRGYDTKGYGYQYLVDRFNEVLGFEWGFDWKIENIQSGTFKSGKEYFEITVALSIYIDIKQGDEINRISRTCAGSHRSKLYGDALKGAITNAFKKTAAFFNCGSEIYRGELDDDNKPIPTGQKQYQQNENRLDFNIVREKIKQMDSDQILEYKKYIWNKYNLSEKQIEALKKIFGDQIQDEQQNLHEIFENEEAF